MLGVRAIQPLVTERTNLLETPSVARPFVRDGSAWQ